MTEQEWLKETPQRTAAKHRQVQDAGTAAEAEMHKSGVHRHHAKPCSVHDILHNGVIVATVTTGEDGLVMVTVAQGVRVERYPREGSRRRTAAL